MKACHDFIMILLCFTAVLVLSISKRITVKGLNIPEYDLKGVKEKSTL